MKLSIPSKSAQCCKGHPFKEGSHIVSELFKNDDWTRKDYCEECYEKNPAAYCTWHTAQHVKKTAPTALLELFRDMQSGDPKELFFLAEILLRQKQLLRRSRSKTEIVVEDADTTDIYWLQRFDLTLSEVRHFSMKYIGGLEEEAKVPHEVEG